MIFDWLVFICWYFVDFFSTIPLKYLESIEETRYPFSTRIDRKMIENSIVLCGLFLIKSRNIFFHFNSTPISTQKIGFIKEVKVFSLRFYLGCIFLEWIFSLALSKHNFFWMKTSDFSCISKMPTQHFLREMRGNKRHCVRAHSGRK